MASPAPVEVGAQGTIGSLVCREIEYLRTREGAGAKNKSGSKKAAPNGGGSRSKARKKGGAFLPSMCSSAEVAVAGSQATRFRYRHLGEPQD